MIADKPATQGARLSAGGGIYHVLPEYSGFSPKMINSSFDNWWYIRT